MKNAEKTIENIVGIFAFIGVIATIIFLINLFNNEDPDNICGAHLGKIDELESEIIYLKDEIDALENQNYELEQDIEDWEEEYDALESSKGCANKGSAVLTDGTKKNQTQLNR